MDRRGPRGEDRRGLVVPVDRRVDGSDASGVAPGGHLSLEETEARVDVAQSEREGPPRRRDEAVDARGEDLGAGEDEVALAGGRDQRGAGEDAGHDGHWRRRLVEGVRPASADAVEDARGTAVVSVSRCRERRRERGRREGERGRRPAADEGREPLSGERLQHLAAPVRDEAVAGAREEVHDHEATLAEDLDDLGEEELAGRAAGGRCGEGEVEAGAGADRPARGGEVEGEGADPGDVARRRDEGVESRAGQGRRRDRGRPREGPARHGEAIAVRGLPGPPGGPHDRGPPAVAREGKGRERLPHSVRLLDLDPDRVPGPRRQDEAERTVREGVGRGGGLRRVVPGDDVAVGTDGPRRADDLDRRLRLPRREADRHEPRLAVRRRQVLGREGRDEVRRPPRDAVDEAAPREVAEARGEPEQELGVSRERLERRDGERAARRLDPDGEERDRPAGVDRREGGGRGRDGERVERLGELDDEARPDGDGRARERRDGLDPGRRRDDPQLEAGDLLPRRLGNDDEGGEVPGPRLHRADRLRPGAQGEGEAAVPVGDGGERPGRDADVEAGERRSVEAEEPARGPGERLRRGEEEVRPFPADARPRDAGRVDRPGRDGGGRLVPRGACHGAEDEASLALLERDEEEVLPGGGRSGEPQGERGRERERRPSRSHADGPDEGESGGRRGRKVGRSERREGDGDRRGDGARGQDERPARRPFDRPALPRDDAPLPDLEREPPHGEALPADRKGRPPRQLARADRDREARRPVRAPLEDEVGEERRRGGRRVVEEGQLFGDEALEREAGGDGRGRGDGQRDGRRLRGEDVCGSGDDGRRRERVDRWQERALERRPRSRGRRRRRGRVRDEDDPVARVPHRRLEEAGGGGRAPPRDPDETVRVEVRKSQHGRRGGAVAVRERELERRRREERRPGGVGDADVNGSRHRPAEGQQDRKPLGRALREGDDGVGGEGARGSEEREAGGVCVSLRGVRARAARRCVEPAAVLLRRRRDRGDRRQASVEQRLGRRPVRGLDEGRATPDVEVTGRGEPDQGVPPGRGEGEEAGRGDARPRAGLWRRDPARDEQRRGARAEGPRRRVVEELAHEDRGLRDRREGPHERDEGVAGAVRDARREGEREADGLEVRGGGGHGEDEAVAEEDERGGDRPAAAGRGVEPDRVAGPKGVRVDRLVERDGQAGRGPRDVPDARRRAVGREGEARGGRGVPRRVPRHDGQRLVRLGAKGHRDPETAVGGHRRPHGHGPAGDDDRRARLGASREVEGRRAEGRADGVEGRGRRSRLVPRRESHRRRSQRVARKVREARREEDLVEAPVGERRRGCDAHAISRDGDGRGQRLASVRAEHDRRRRHRRPVEAFAEDEPDFGREGDAALPVGGDRGDELRRDRVERDGHARGPLLARRLPGASGDGVRTLDEREVDDPVAAARSGGAAVHGHRLDVLRRAEAHDDPLRGRPEAGAVLGRDDRDDGRRAVHGDADARRRLVPERVARRRGERRAAVGEGDLGPDASVRGEPGRDAVHGDGGEVRVFRAPGDDDGRGPEDRSSRRGADGHRRRRRVGRDRDGGRGDVPRPVARRRRERVRPFDEGNAVPAEGAPLEDGGSAFDGDRLEVRVGGAPGHADLPRADQGSGRRLG